MTGISIAIDGPAGAGKSTVSKALAAATGFALLDTGAMYRAATWLCIQQSALGNKQMIAKVISDHAVEINIDRGKTLAFVDGNEITEFLRDKEITAAVSEVAAVKEVRDWAVKVQRTVVENELTQGNGIVLEGRDIGTTVLPNATFKFFLTASDEKRAQRRALEVSAAPEVILGEIIKRDELDSSRAISPLRQAEDAILIDASDMTVDQVVQKILEIVGH